VHLAEFPEHAFWSFLFVLGATENVAIASSAAVVKVFCRISFLVND
jgi:hypothetical protein